MKFWWPGMIIALAVLVVVFVLVGFAKLACWLEDRIGGAGVLWYIGMILLFVGLLLGFLVPLIQ